MAFKLELAQAAELDILEAVNYIATDSQTHAVKWFEDLFFALEKLRTLPVRYALIPEARYLKRALHSMPYHSHRVIFEVQEQSNTIFIVRVYHGSRKPLTQTELD